MSRDARIGAGEVARSVSGVLSEVDRSAAKTAESRTLRDLVEELGPAVDRSGGAS